MRVGERYSRSEMHPRPLGPRFAPVSWCCWVRSRKEQNQGPAASKPEAIELCGGKERRSSESASSNTSPRKPTTGQFARPATRPSEISRAEIEEATRRLLKETTALPSPSAERPGNEVRRLPPWPSAPRESLGAASEPASRMLRWARFALTAFALQDHGRRINDD